MDILSKHKQPKYMSCEATQHMKILRNSNIEGEKDLRSKINSEKNAMKPIRLTTRKTIYAELRRAQTM